MIEDQVTAHDLAAHILSSRASIVQDSMYLLKFWWRQVSPKRCGYTQGKGVVSQTEAVSRVQAAVDAREEGADILIMARNAERHPWRTLHALLSARLSCCQDRCCGSHGA